MKIQEMYHVKRIEPAIASLERWYNRVLDKEPEEMTIGDILRALRQSVFVEVAEEMLIKNLQADVFAGDMTEGEMMEALSRLSANSIAKFNDDVKTIVSTAEAEADHHEWIDETDKKDYLKSVDKVKSNLLEYSEK